MNVTNGIYIHLSSFANEANIFIYVFAKEISIPYALIPIERRNFTTFEYIFEYIQIQAYCVYL